MIKKGSSKMAGPKAMLSARRFSSTRCSESRHNPESNTKRNSCDLSPLPSELRNETSSKRMSQPGRCSDVCEVLLMASPVSKPGAVVTCGNGISLVRG
jgi:hypothetical protein